MSNKIKQDWDNATWIGSRQAMIRLSLKLTVRERLQALEEMSKTSKKLASIKKHPNQSPPGGK
jgi:hypothetical protein